MKNDEKDYLFPKDSFVIQIKSKQKKKIDIKKIWVHIADLKLPFFIGIVNKKKAMLSIYSGEIIPFFFSLNGGIKNNWKIYIELIERRGDDLYKINEKTKQCIVKFPKITEVDFNFDYKKERNKIDELFEICKLTQHNISTKRIEEHVYQHKDGKFSIVTWSGSAKIFRDNFFLRLAEIFANLKWLYENIGVKKQKIKLKKEFKFYESVYKNLESNSFEIKHNSKQILVRMYNLCRKSLKN